MSAEKERILQELGCIPEAVYDQLVREFIMQSHDQIKRMKAACKATDSKRFLKETHSMKGAAGNLRLSAIFEVTQSLEEEVKTGSMGDSVEKLLNTLNEMVSSVENIYTV